MTITRMNPGVVKGARNEASFVPSSGVRLVGALVQFAMLSRLEDN